MQLNNDCLIVIPARYGSTRLPAKVLELIDGKPVIQWVYQAAQKANAGDVIIATDSKIVVEAAKKFGGAAVMTSEPCQSGTDRVYEAAQKSKANYIVNLQGDEPFVQPETVRNVVKQLQKDAQADIMTACFPTLDLPSVANPNNVKAVLSGDLRALYFSRSPIPYKRDIHDEEAHKKPFYIHCGIYAFKRAALEKFVKLPKSNLENLEKLEQLRALEAGMTIKSILIKKAGPAIDTIEDLHAAREYSKENN